MTTLTTAAVLPDAGSEKKKPIQRFKAKRSDKFESYMLANHARGQTVLPDGHRMRVRARADGTFDLVIYEPV